MKSCHHFQVDVLAFVALAPLVFIKVQNVKQLGLFMQWASIGTWSKTLMMPHPTI
jgi:hypothetical protein